MNEIWGKIYTLEKSGNVMYKLLLNIYFSLFYIVILPVIKQLYQKSAGFFNPAFLKNYNFISTINLFLSPL